MLTAEKTRLFQQWLRNHKGLMFKVARVHAGPEDMDDLFQEILFNVWSSIPSFRREAEASTWIYKVALNTALTWNRVENKRRQRHKPLLKTDDIADSTRGSGEAWETHRRLDRLYKLIHELPRIDSSIVLLYLDGLSYREMAQILGISESNVGVKLCRIKKRLAEFASGERDEY